METIIILGLTIILWIALVLLVKLIGYLVQETIYEVRKAKRAIKQACWDFEWWWKINVKGK